MPRSVAVLQYWIISTGLRRSNYGVSTLSLDDGGTFRQPITTQHLEATTGMFTFFLCCCVCAVSRLSAFHTDRWRLSFIGKHIRRLHSPAHVGNAVSMKALSVALSFAVASVFL